MVTIRVETAAKVRVCEIRQRRKKKAYNGSGRRNQ